MLNETVITAKLRQALEPLPFIRAFWLEGADAAGTADAYSDIDSYLTIDFCWQFHSRPADEYAYIENDSIETAKVIFDKDNIIRYKPLNLIECGRRNRQRLDEAKYRRQQHICMEKYVRRRQFLEAYAYYGKYVLEPLIDLLRLIYTPAMKLEA